MDRETDKQTHTARQTTGHTDYQTDRLAKGKTGRHTDIKDRGQADRQTDRQIDTSRQKRLVSCQPVVHMSIFYNICSLSPSTKLPSSSLADIKRTQEIIAKDKVRLLFLFSTLHKRRCSLTMVRCLLETVGVTVSMILNRLDCSLLKVIQLKNSLFRLRVLSILLFMRSPFLQREFSSTVYFFLV